MQIKVSKLQKTVDGDVQGANAVVIFLDRGNIVHEERFTGKTTGSNDHPFKRKVVWDGKYDKHEAVILDAGAVFKYELDLEDGRDQDAMTELTKQAESLGLYNNVRMESFEFPQDGKPKSIRNSQTKKNADK